MQVSGLAAYAQQLEFQGWDYYVLGSPDLSPNPEVTIPPVVWSGPRTRVEAIRAFLRLVDPDQLVVVTPIINLLVLEQPTAFADRFAALQVSEVPQDSLLLSLMFSSSLSQRSSATDSVLSHSSEGRHLFWFLS